MSKIQGRIDAIVEILDEKKADEIEVFDLSSTDYIAKAVVLANSLGGKHTTALLDHLKDALKPKGEEFLHTDQTEDWAVADLGDIIVHIMTPAYRQRYSLEEFLGELRRGELG
jgi:ribosome silencing factor RsfS/YbeB/iojap